MLAEDKKSEIQNLLLALITALTPEMPEARTDQELRMFVLSQITDYSGPAKGVVDMADLLFQWLKHGKREEGNLKVVK